LKNSQKVFFLGTLHFQKNMSWADVARSATQKKGLLSSEGAGGSVLPTLPPLPAASDDGGVLQGEKGPTYEWELIPVTSSLSPYLCTLLKDFGAQKTSLNDALVELERLLDFNVDLNETDETGETIFHKLPLYEYDHTNYPFFDRILEMGTSKALNRSNLAGDTPFGLAIRFHKLNMAAKLVSRGAKADGKWFFPSGVSHSSKLFELIACHTPECILGQWFSFLLYNTCNLSPRPANGSKDEKTKRRKDELKDEKEHLESVAFYLEKDAQPNWREGLPSAITQCGQYDDAFSIKILRIFWENKFVLTYADGFGCTVLDVAIQNKSLNICKFLLHADVSLETLQHPCSWQAAKEFPEFLELPVVKEYLEGGS
jgi:ankyrin repeat protein